MSFLIRHLKRCQRVGVVGQLKAGSAMTNEK